MRSGPLCALLWRILTWCTRKQVTLKARHIPGKLNVVADELSRPGQTIQTEWSLLPEVFQTICSRWRRPHIDQFVFVSPVPDPLASAVDALSLLWEDLDAYAFPPGVILGLPLSQFGWAKVRYMLGNTETLDTNLTGQTCPCTHQPAFFLRISWPKRVQTVWPQWLYQPWPQLWIGPSRLTGPSAQSEHCATFWTGPQTSGRIRS